MPDVTAASSIRGDHLPASTPMKGKCDVCTKPDQFQGHFLLKCKQCGVLVHELCYGLNPKGKHDPNFICLACKYIGSKIEVNIPSIIGGCGEDMSKTREFMTQMERPKECVLCNHHEGIHAIHPLYDTHGPEGRHYVLPQTGDLAHRKEKRLAWVHTLCASFLGDYFQTRGCVYGCDIYGNYDHDDESDDEEEDENDDFCYYCGKAGGEILCCDGCVKAFHSDCLKVEDVSSLPDPWYCPFCESLCKQDEAKGAKDFPGGKEERGNCYPSDSDAVARFKIGTKVSKYFLDEKIGQKRPFAGEVVNYFHQRKRYRVRYDEDGEEEDLTENQIAKIQGLPQEKIMNVHHFVIDNKSEFIKGLRNLKCVICKSTNGKLRIPVQCTAGTDHVLDCFPDSLRADEKDRKSGNQGCLHAIHVGCARWKAREKYARYKGKAVRLCYYYPGQKANFEEDCDGKTKIITKDPKSNIFCRTHCHEIINSQVMTS